MAETSVGMAAQHGQPDQTGNGSKVEKAAENAVLKLFARAMMVAGIPSIIAAGGVYVAGECAIRMLGASTTDRKRELSIDAEISNFGAYGIYAQFVDEIDVSGVYVHNIGYAGAAFLSCDRGRAVGFRAKDIGPGTMSNAYGLTLSHNSAGYDEDPNAGTPMAGHPFCADWVVADGVAENIPWAGFDAHGGYRVEFRSLKTFNCKHGAHLSGSTGDASGYAGWDNRIVGCTVDSRKRDGSPGDYANAGIGINMAGGAVQLHLRPQAIGNTIIGYGIVDNAGGTPSLSAELTQCATLRDNVFMNWGGVAVNCSTAQDFLAAGHRFYDLVNGADTEGVCFKNTGTTGLRQSFTDNVAVGGKTGLYSRSSVRSFISGNQFAVATPLNFAASHFFAGNDGTPVLFVPLAGGTTTLDLSADFPYGSRSVVVVLNASAPTTVTNITGVPVMTRVQLLVADGSANVTFDRSYATLGGSAEWVGTSFDSLCLLCWSVSGSVRWTEEARSANG